MNRPPFPLEQPGPQELKLREAIDQFDLPESAQPCPQPVTIILFTNRSGSSMVAEHLRATGRFRGMGEPLNPDRVLTMMARDGLDSFHGYLRSRVEREPTDASMFGLKASLQQVMMLWRAGVIPHYFRDVRWVFVQRRDLVAQAASFDIATQTRQWESFATSSGAQPQYGFERMRKKLTALTMQNASINAYFAVMGIQPQRVLYEEFCEDPLQSTTELAARLGMEGAVVDPAKLRRERQRDDINAGFCDNFRRDYRAWLLARQPG
jgi:LPS sulfotransferase NodH